MPGEFLHLGERLRSERTRIGLNQADFAALGGVKRNSQVEYETGKTAPKADYLAALHDAGIDVMYVLTGTRGGSKQITAEDADVLYLFHKCDAGRRAHVVQLLGYFTEGPQPAPQDRPTLQAPPKPYMPPSKG